MKIQMRRGPHRLKVLVVILTLGTASAVLAEKGVAILKGTAAESSIAGTVSFQDTQKGLEVTATLAGLAPGLHAFHIHQFGLCADIGKAAGGHYNPKSSPHGYLPKDGPHRAHAGDMGNLTVGADGTARLKTVLPKITLSQGKSTVAGRAVIVHEKVDDFSQPVGNAGGRVACGVITITGE
ncbi:MAG: superoxide dismutase family protein [Elusimicrobia bacterium]|jgi:Cu-Zn family superoxide dismutase|nr:superoxide dismutase family protein [Elusimicrobiota bacterium]